MEFKTLNKVNDGESARPQQHPLGIWGNVGEGRGEGKGVMVEDSLTINYRVSGASPGATKTINQVC